MKKYIMLIMVGSSSLCLAQSADERGAIWAAQTERAQAQSDLNAARTEAWMAQGEARDAQNQLNKLKRQQQAPTKEDIALAAAAYEQYQEITLVKKHFPAYSTEYLQRLNESNFRDLYQSALHKEAVEDLVKSGKGFPKELDMRVIKPFDCAGYRFKVGTVIHVINVPPDGAGGQTMVGKTILSVHIDCCERVESK